MNSNDVPSDFLASTAVIDAQHDAIRTLAGEIAKSGSEERTLIRNSFEWVRDNIQHSYDYQRDEVTCQASEVHEVGAGFCYAKSHLLAALLRANGVPAGFCYQRLRMDDESSRLCIHGLNAVFVDGHGWYRIDCRGNKPGVDAQFCPPAERLAFEPKMAGEFDFPDVWAEPIPAVVNGLKTAVAVGALSCQLPDLAWEDYKIARTNATICPVLPSQAPS